MVLTVLWLVLLSMSCCPWFSHGVFASNDSTSIHRGLLSLHMLPGHQAEAAMHTADMAGAAQCMASPAHVQHGGCMALWTCSMGQLHLSVHTTGCRYTQCSQHNEHDTMVHIHCGACFRVLFKTKAVRCSCESQKPWYRRNIFNKWSDNFYNLFKSNSVLGSLQRT